MTSLGVVVGRSRGVRLATVMRAGLLAAALDIGATAAVEVAILRQGTFAGILRFVASGLLGPPALGGGPGVAAIGGTIHVGIAMAWTAIFALGAAYLPWRLRSRRVIAAVGLAYGAVVWLLMAFVALRLSHIGAPDIDRDFWIQLVIHMTCVGLPIALVVLGSRPAP